MISDEAYLKGRAWKKLISAVRDRGGAPGEISCFRLRLCELESDPVREC